MDVSHERRHGDALSVLRLRAYLSRRRTDPSARRLSPLGASTSSPLGVVALETRRDDPRQCAGAPSSRWRARAPSWRARFSRGSRRSARAPVDPSDPSTRVVADAPSNAAHARRVSAFAGPAPRRPRPGRAIARALRDVRDAPALDAARDALAAARAFGEAVEDALDVVVSNVAEELLWMSDDSDASTFASTWSPDPAASSHHVPHPAPPAPPAPPPPRPPAYDFARKGPHRVATREVEFFWPRLGLDLARRITPRVPAVVRVPSALPGRPGPFPVVAFGIGWNSWTGGTPRR